LSQISHPTTSRRRSTSLFPALVITLLIAGAAAVRPAHAADAPKPAPDVIVFNNGDQLSGKLLRYVGGNVVFHSDIAGDLTVSPDKIKEIRSTQKFVVLQKGDKISRKVDESKLPIGQITLAEKNFDVHTESGSVSATIPMEKITYVVDQPTFEKELRHEPGFFHAWTGAVTAGATIVQATQNTYTFNGAVALVRQVPTVPWLNPRNRTSIDFTGSYGKVTEPGTPSVKTAIYHADAERDEYFSPRVYALAAVAFDHNFSQSLDLQQIYGGGIGWTVIKQDKQELDLKALMQYEKQTFLDAVPGTNQNLIGSTFNVSYMRKLPKGMLFAQQASYLPAWNNLHAYSASETDTLSLPVYKKLSMTVGTIDSYLNDPAVTVPPTKRNSFQFTFGATYNLP
jgi:hypothetical protein